MIKLKMKNYNAILTEKQQKYQQYLTGDEILPSDQSRIIQQGTFTYSPFGKASEKQIKTIEEQGKNKLRL